MALGKRKRQHQQTFWVAADKLGGGPRNAFYERLNQLLGEIDFDGKLEKAAEPHYEKTGRKGLPPGVYFRMIFIGYFEDISSQRGIAWRCDDKYEEIYLKEYASGTDLNQGLRSYFAFYGHQRKHSSLDRQTPTEVYRSGRSKRIGLSI